jgi:hypothetical protein
MNNKIKYVFLTVSAIVFIAALVNFTIALKGYINQKNRIAEMDNRLSELVESSVETCYSVLDDWGQADEKTIEFVNDYVENINNAESVRQKSYIAESMLAYVAKIITYSNFFLKEDANDIPHPVMTYDRLENKLGNLTLQLSAARDFDNYTSDNASTEDTSQDENSEDVTADENGNVVYK